jgi:hypothetical protein
VLVKERERQGFLELKPWAVKKRLQLGSFDTAVRLIRLLEEAVRGMPLEGFGGQQRITFEDFLRVLLRPRSEMAKRAP